MIKKSKLIGSIFLLILFSTSTVNAQNSFNDFAEGLRSIPNFFIGLLDDFQNLGERTDRDKMKNFCGLLISDLGETLIIKEKILNEAQNATIDKDELKADIVELEQNISKLKELFTRYNDLILNFSNNRVNANTFTRNLKSDFIQKEQLLEKLSEDNNNQNKRAIIDDIELGIEILNESVTKIQEFKDKLQS